MELSLSIICGRGDVVTRLMLRRPADAYFVTGPRLSRCDGEHTSATPGGAVKSPCEGALGVALIAAKLDRPSRSVEGELGCGGELRERSRSQSWMTWAATRGRAMVVSIPRQNRGFMLRAAQSGYRGR